MSVIVYFLPFFYSDGSPEKAPSSSTTRSKLFFEFEFEFEWPFGPQSEYRGDAIRRLIRKPTLGQLKMFHFWTKNRKKSERNTS